MRHECQDDGTHHVPWRAFERKEPIKPAVCRTPGTLTMGPACVKRSADDGQFVLVVALPRSISGMPLPVTVGSAPFQC